MHSVAFFVDLHFTFRFGCLFENIWTFFLNPNSLHLSTGVVRTFAIKVITKLLFFDCGYCRLLSCLNYSCFFSLLVVNVMGLLNYCVRYARFTDLLCSSISVLKYIFFCILVNENLFPCVCPFKHVLQCWVDSHDCLKPYLS